MKFSARSCASVFAVVALSSVALLNQAQGSRTPKQIALTEDGFPYVRGEYLVKVRSSDALERLLDKLSVRAPCTRLQVRHHS